MNLRITRASALVIGIALAGAAVATPQDHDSRPQARSTLDRNHDGAIDRSEAAAHPRLAAHFDRMDRDGDGKIERGEQSQVLSTSLSGLLLSRRWLVGYLKEFSVSYRAKRTIE